MDSKTPSHTKLGPGRRHAQGARSTEGLANLSPYKQELVTKDLESPLTSRLEPFRVLNIGKLSDLRRKFGKTCPACVRSRADKPPSILLPGQKCRFHKYRDSRSPDLVFRTS